MPKTKPIIKPTFNTPEEKKEFIKLKMKEWNKKYKMDVAHFADEERDIEPIPVGVPAIDDGIGVLLARGRITTIYGSSGAGKTSIGHQITAVAQKKGLSVCFIALEPYDKERAKIFGVDTNNLTILQFPVAENALDCITESVNLGLFDVIILDSINSLSPKRAQQEKSGELKSLENENMALLASKLSSWFPMILDPMKRSRTALLLIGQTRTKIGFISLQGLSGGMALYFYSKIIIYIREGKSADSPTKKEKVIVTEFNEETGEAEEKEKTITKPIGFNMILKVEKAQVTGTKEEGTVVQLPYYYSSGFTAPKEKETKINKIEDAGNKVIDNIKETTKSAIEVVKEQEEKPQETAQKKRGRPKGWKKGKLLNSNEIAEIMR